MDPADTADYVLDLYEQAWLAWGEKHLSPPELERLKVRLAHVRAEKEVEERVFSPMAPFDRSAD